MGAGADEVRAYRQPQDRQGARARRAALTAWTRRQGDRIEMPFAAAHESVHGTKQTLLIHRMSALRQKRPFPNRENGCASRRARSLAEFMSLHIQRARPQMRWQTRAERGRRGAPETTDRQLSTICCSAVPATAHYIELRPRVRGDRV